MNERLIALGKFEIAKKELISLSLQSKVLRQSTSEVFNPHLGGDFEDMNFTEIIISVKQMEKLQEQILKTKKTMDELNEIYNFTA